MATAKFTAKRQDRTPKDVVVAAGSAEAQSDTISVNIDYTNMKKGDVLIQLEYIQQKIASGKWPPL